MPSNLAAAAWVKPSACSRSLRRTASCTRNWRSSGSASPKSLNTLPEPVSMAWLAGAAFVLAFMVCLVVLLRQFEALVNQINIALRRANAAGRLLLEAMQHIHRLGKAHRVHRPERVAPMVVHQLQHACAFALPRFGLRGRSSHLHRTQRV